MRTALITLSAEGLAVARGIAAGLAECDLFVHQIVPACGTASRFHSVVELTAELFPVYRQLVYIMPTGVVTRAIAPHVVHKLRDPAVVVCDVRGRWAISLLSGHEGGANLLALRVANAIGAEPIVTTTTEAVRTLTVGVGCRRGTAAAAIVAAVRAALGVAGRTPAEVRTLASIDLKADEPGLLAAAAELELPLRFFSAERIRSCDRAFTPSALVQAKIKVPAVAEPAALLAGTWTRLLVPRQVYAGVTVAVAEENCTLSASAPAAN